VNVKTLIALMLSAALSYCAMCYAAPAAAQVEKKTAASLKAGDPAPPLAVGGWVKGEPVERFEKGTVYVLEYWATWCGPCVAAMPHVTELQKKYADRGLVVIGMNVWENDDAAVEPFVKKMGEKLGYRVATDDKSDGGKGKMAETWMAAAGQNGIPCGFIIDRDTKVAWIGPPAGLDKAVQKVLDGKLDILQEAARQARAEAAMKKLGRAMEDKAWDAALAAVDELITADPDLEPRYLSFKVMFLGRKKDYKGANKLAKELSEGEHAREQQLLVGLAYALLGDGDPREREVDVDLALSVAQKGAAMGGDLGKRAMVFVAKGHAAKGDYAKAVEAQTAAMAGTEGRPNADIQAKLERMQMQKDLDEYKARAKERANR
jgi:thiol-disulfide isomerase/thioredoxin